MLPFTNLGANLANDYFSDGLTDEITEGLARISTLRVIARGSAFQFKGNGEVLQIQPQNAEECGPAGFDTGQLIVPIIGFGEEAVHHAHQACATIAGL